MLNKSAANTQSERAAARTFYKHGAQDHGSLERFSLLPERVWELIQEQEPESNRLLG